MTIVGIHALTAMSSRQLDTVAKRLATDDTHHGRPWSCSLLRRVIITCAALRTNLTLRELAVVFGISKSSVQRIIATITPRLAALAAHGHHDRRFTWSVDGTLIPTRDHAAAAKSKNYRWSCNAQVLVRRRDLCVIATSAGGSGNRNDPLHYRGSRIERLCKLQRRVLADGGYRGVPELGTPVFRHNRIVRNRAWRHHRHRRARVEHAIARLKDWRVLRDHRRRGCHLQNTVQAVAYLHNLRLVDELRDKS